jgi:hypothetical protein
MTINIDGSINSKEKYKTEIDELKSILVTDKTDFRKYRGLRHELLKSIRHKGFLTLSMLNLLFQVYKNKDKLPFLYNLVFKDNKILVGAESNFLKLNFDFFSDNQQEFNYILPLDVKTQKDKDLNAIFERFLIQYKSNKQVLEKEKIDNNNFLLFNNNISKIIFSYFKELSKEVKDDSNSLEFSDLNSLNNIYSLKSFCEKYHDSDKMELLYNLNKDYINNHFSIKDYDEFLEITKDFDSINADDLFIPSNDISLEDIFNLLNIVENPDFVFLLSPFVGYSNFHHNILEGKVIKAKIKIISSETINANDFYTIVSKIKYICPKCNKKVYLKPISIGADIYHACNLFEKGRVKINRNILTIDTQTSVYLYKCDVYYSKDYLDDKISDVYIFSFKDNLIPGFYVVDLFKTYSPFNILKKSPMNFNYILLGNIRNSEKNLNDSIIKSYSEISKIINNLNISEENKTQFLNLENIIYNKTGLPKHKLFNILFSIRHFYNNSLNQEINDSGLLLQIFALLASISRNCFLENKLAISVMGVGSISKTYPVNMIFNMLDLNYKYISDSARMSTAGMSGGVNTNAIINGQNVKKFEKGAISNNGVVTFDECQAIFLKEDIQSIIKSIPQDTYEISVVGGSKTNFNCTPVFLSNFNYFAKDYKNKITDAYLLKYKSTYKNQSDRFLKTNEDIIKYIEKLNLYMPIEFYYDTLNDKILSKIIYSVRKSYEHERKDWKTGSQIESMNRILFDVAIHNKISRNYSEIKGNLLKDVIDLNENNNEIFFNENYPVQQTNQELLKYIYGGDWDGQKINLNQFNKNKPEIITQLKKLEKDVAKFLTEEELGKNITKYFLQNVDNFDKKIRHLVIKVIIILQLIDDIKAIELSDNVKKLSNAILLMCKRGLDKDEYDFKLITTEVKHYDDLHSDFLVDIEDTKTQLYYEEKMKREMEMLEKEMGEKYALTKKEDDSLSDLKIENIVDGDFNDLENLNKEYTLKEICKKLNFESEDEQELIDFIKKYKQIGVVYEPRSGIYKTEN